MKNKIHELIATKLGYVDLEHMLLNSDAIDELAKKAINLLCESYKTDLIF